MTDGIGGSEFLRLQEALKGRYSLDRELGRGGMGIVFLARDVALDRLVAIKLLPPEVTAIAERRQRFLREARTAAGLAHPNIVPIHAVEERDDLVFFVMGFVDGESLGARVRREGALPAADAMRIVQEVAWALGHAHGRGVIHRDVKPDNVLLERDTGRALVTDFGIARQVDQATTPSHGSVVGTPKYMSPEQGAGATVDARSDLYSLGVTAFLTASGVLPFTAENAAGYLVKHATEPAPPLRERAPHFPTRFCLAVDRCLAKDPSERFGSAEDFAAEVGAARGALVRVPAALQHFVRHASAVGSEAGGYLVGTIGVVAALEIYKLIEGDVLGIPTAIELLMVVLFTGISATRVAGLLPMARQLLRNGYSANSVAAALTHEERWSDRNPPVKSRSADVLITAGTGAALTALGMWGMNADANLVIVFGFALTVGAPLVTLRRLWDRLGGSRVVNRALRGRIGRWLFRLAGKGMVGRPLPAPGVGERTEMVLGRVIEELFAALPESDREALADVPRLVADLEADALELRQQAEHDPAMANRLADAVTAMETLRLDLMRVAAGESSMEELTHDLARLRAIGTYIDDRLRGAREVDAILTESRGASTPS